MKVSVEKMEGVFAPNIWYSIGHIIGGAAHDLLDIAGYFI